MHIKNRIVRFARTGALTRRRPFGFYRTRAYIFINAIFFFHSTHAYLSERFKRTNISHTTASLTADSRKPWGISAVAMRGLARTRQRNECDNKFAHDLRSLCDDVGDSGPTSSLLGFDVAHGVARGTKNFVRVNFRSFLEVLMKRLMGRGKVGRCVAEGFTLGCTFENVGVGVNYFADRTTGSVLTICVIFHYT